jgi:Holliday junction resolvasome RuvABC endonuclease subunit
MNILALDLGTKTGWARLQDGAVTSGTWLLADEKELRNQRKENLDRCCDMRFERLQKHIIDSLPVDYIFFEDVTFLTSQLQSQLWAGFRTVVTLLYPKIKLRAIPVGTLKKFGTGNGAAKKDLMAACLQARTGLSPEGRDDNEVDALHLLWLARKELNA